jgi:hypothetical protein
MHEVVYSLNHVTPPLMLNPMFGNEKRIVHSGLMSEEQYFKARQNLLCKMQDILDKTILSSVIMYCPLIAT